MPKQERAERTRSAILKAAAEEFDEFGYEGARLDRIVERTGATKGAVYFHFRSKLDIARALVEDKYTNWPVIVAEVTGSGARGIDAAEQLTQRVAAVYVKDVRVRAAMTLSQTVLPPSVEDNPYDKWIQLVAVFVRQALDDASETDEDQGRRAAEIATVAVQGFFGAYMIAHELGRLSQLSADVERLWAILGASLRTSIPVEPSRLAPLA